MERISTLYQNYQNVPETSLDTFVMERISTLELTKEQRLFPEVDESHTLTRTHCDLAIYA